MMSNPFIPDHMTSGWLAYDGPAVEKGIIRGHVLTRRMTRYLDDALRGWSREQKLQQLDDLDWRMARAQRLRDRGQTPQQIAGNLKCSLATAYRLLARTRQYLLAGVEVEPDTHAARAAQLNVMDPQALGVWTLRNYGFSVVQIGAMMDLDEGTVRLAYTKARKALGENRRDLARRHIRNVLASLEMPGGEFDPSVLPELVEQNAKFDKKQNADTLKA